MSNGWSLRDLTAADFIIEGIYLMNGVRPLPRWPDVCLAGPLFALMVPYPTSGAMDFPQGWMRRVEQGRLRHRVLRQAEAAFGAGG